MRRPSPAASLLALAAMLQACLSEPESLVTTSAPLLPGDLVAAPPAYDPGGAANVLAADLDRDGHADVIALPASGPAQVLRGRADGGVDLLAPLPGISDARAGVLVDLDLDGDLDVVTTCVPCSQLKPRLALSRWTSEAQLRFKSADLFPPSPLWKVAGVPVVFDYLADGDPDLLFLSAQGKHGVLLDNQVIPAGVAQQLDATWAVPANLGKVRVALGVDLDDDGVDEVYLARPGVDGLLVDLGFGQLGDVGATRGLARSGDELALAAADIDGDGDQDLVRLHPGGGLSAVLGGAGALLEIDLDVVGPADATSLASADLDGDGHPELVVAGGATQVFAWRGKPGDVHFEPLPLGLPAATSLAALAFAPGRASLALAGAGPLNLLHTSPSDVDCDGIADHVERRLGLDPDDPRDARRDDDGDHIRNREEQRAGGAIHDADSDRDGAGDRDDLLAGLDRDGDGRAERRDSCPKVPDDGADRDADGLGDACDPSRDGEGTPGLRSIAVLRDWTLDEHAAAPVHQRDDTRFLADLRGRLPSGESFTLLDGPPLAGFDPAGAPLVGAALVEYLHDGSGDHAYVHDEDAAELLALGYRRLDVLGWTVQQPLAGFGQRELYRLVTWHAPDAGDPHELRREEAITADPARRDALLARGYQLRGSLGWVGDDRGRLRGSVAVVRYRQEGVKGGTRHSTALAAEPLAALAGERVDAEAPVFRVFPEATGATRPLVRLRDAGGGEILITRADQLALYEASGYQRETVIGHVVDPARRYDGFEPLAPLVRFWDAANSTFRYETDGEAIVARVAELGPGEVLGLVVPQPVVGAKCPAPPPAPDVASKLAAIADPLVRAQTTLIGLLVGCELTRAEAGARDSLPAQRIADVLAANADGYTQGKLRERVTRFLALDAGQRAELLGPLAGLDPGDCSQAPDYEQINQRLLDVTMELPEYGQTIRQPQCTGAAYVTPDPEGRAARSLVVAGLAPGTSGENSQLFDPWPRLYGVLDIAGQTRLSPLAQNGQPAAAGLPLGGAPTGIPCGNNNPCDASEGLRCEQGTCRAFPILKKGEKFTFTGVNTWDAMSGHLRFKKLGSSVPSKPIATEIVHNDPVLSPVERCDRDPQNDHPDALAEISTRVPVAVEEGAFYEVLFYNQNGHYFLPDEQLPGDEQERERLGRTVHVCWDGYAPPPAQLGTNFLCHRPMTACADGAPACTGAFGTGGFVMPPRSLAECASSKPYDYQLRCGETPGWFGSEAHRAIVFVEKQRPDDFVEVALEGVRCDEETEADWPGDDEFFLQMVVSAAAAQVPPSGGSWQDVISSSTFAGDFDSGSTWVARGDAGRGVKSSIVRVPGGIPAGVLVRLVEDDDRWTEMIIGTLVVVIYAAVASATVIGIVGTAAGLISLWGAVLAMFPDPDDRLGSGGWMVSKNDVLARGNGSHDGIVADEAEALAVVAGAFNDHALDPVTSDHPGVDAWAALVTAHLGSCALSCPSHQRCDGGVCVPGDWVDSSQAQRFAGQHGFLERRQFIADDPESNYTVYLRYLAGSAPAP